MKITHVLLLFLLSFCWGPSFFFIKIALEGFNPFLIVNLRVLLGFIVLLTLLILKKQPLFKWARFSLHFLVMGLLACAIPWTFLCFAEQKVSSSIAGIINSAVPIVTFILAHYFLDHEKISKQKLIGLIIGVCGVVLIFVPNLFQSFGAHLIGFFYLAISTICSASAMIYARRHLIHVPSLVSPTYQLFYAFLIMIPLTWIFSDSSKFQMPPLSAILSLIVLGVVGTGIAFYIFYYLINHVGATYTSTTSLLIPLIAIFFGVVFLEEKLIWTSYLGCGFIIVSLVITNSLVSVKMLKQMFEAKENND
jgi:drug/metabolite transporter (DMT)-like permease